ncbi:hypothetical protein EP47_00330 [Legionella norrlandica]|uniref:Uncharacterized protein n=1 Tax=Legionella norrlandica TaxID=1498499 RepID=A0A0A2SY29_9GAMM|nr:hypothetical protein [Legionella norrlandica]KGP64329.1 hypothetical protein EP47_00330 [Legionella norrlandica]
MKRSSGPFFQKNPPVARRSLWTGASKRDYYPSTKQEKWIFSSHCFPTTTFRGKKILDPEFDNAFNFLMNAKYERLVFRGMQKRETKDPINIALAGLIGRKPLVVYDESKQVKLEETKESVKKHRKGDVRGVSTTAKLGMGLSFSNYLPKSHLMIVVDLVNVPKNQRYAQDYTESVDVDAGGQLVNYSHEGEITISSVHASAVLMRVTRDGLSINIEYNPLYIDQNLLPQELKEDYEDLLKTFYETAYDIRNTEDVELIKAFQTKQNAFYRRVAEYMQLDTSHTKALEIEAISNEDFLTKEMELKKPFF